MILSESHLPHSRRFGIVGFAIIAMLLMAGGLAFYRHKAKEIIREQHQIIAAIGTLKSRQIQTWRKERQSDAWRAVRGPSMRRLMGEFLRNPGSEKTRTDLLDLLRLDKMSSMYESASLLALDGQVLLSTEDTTNPVDPATLHAATAAAASQDPVFSDFFKHADGLMHIDIAAAVRDAEGRPVAIVVLHCNADAMLFPLIQVWPLPNYSGETVLVLRTGDEASVPHKLRFEAESAPRWHQPLTRTTFPAVAAVLGKQGLSEGVDYRGKQVLADVRPVPESPWFILNKIDRDEALAQLHLDALFIGLITGALILLAGAAIAYYYRHRQAEGFRALYESEQTKFAIERTLLAANQKLALLFEQTPQGVIEWDLAFRVTRWNPAAERIFGFSAAEAIGQQASFIVSESVRPFLAPIMQALLDGKGGKRSTNENVRKDGTVILCDWYNTSLSDAEGHVVGIASQVDDITERKRMEDALRENEDRYRDLVDNSMELISTYDLEGNIISANETMVRISGYPREALLKMNMTDLMVPKMRHLFPEYLRTLRTDEKAQGIMRIQTAHGETRFWEYESTLRTEGVATPIVRGMGLDITERRQAEKALRASESQLQVILESTDDGILAVDHHGKVLKTNRRFAEIWNIPQSLIAGGDDQALLGHVLAQLCDPNAFLKKVQSLYASDAKDLDLVHFKDGRCFERFTAPMLEGSVLTGRVWSFRDITERKRTEEAIRESHERFELANRATFDVIWDWDLRTNVFWRNDHFQSLFGYSRDEVETSFESSTSRIHPEDLESLTASIQVALDGKSEFWANHYRFRRKDSSYVTVEDRAIITRDSDGHAIRMLGAMQDISERKQAEEALLASEARNRAVTQSAPDAIITADSEGNVVGWNRGAEVIFGYAESEAMGQPLTTMIPERYREKHLAGMDRVKADGEQSVIGKTVELNGVRKDGSEFPLELSLAEWESTEGWFVTSIIRDITEHKRREEEQKRLDQALQETNVELGVAKQANLAKSEFLSAMSHELRTPLIGITGMLEVLTQSDLDAEQRQVAGIIRESSESLLSIIGDILDFSKIEADKMELAPHTFSARALMESVSKIFRPATSAKGLNFLVEVDPRIAPAHVADVLRIRQILNNFLSNAVKFTEKGSIKLRIRLLGSPNGTETLAFEVQDTGIGVPPENISKLFDPFSQAEASTTRRFGGTGLGLTISRRLAQLMGGSLNMQSTLGQGSTVTLTIALAVGAEQDIVDLDLQDESQPAPLRPTPSILAAEQERSLVLLAEDHPTNRIVLTQQINRAGYALETAEDGQEAFEKWQSGRYGLILTDLHMPRMDGYQLTEAVRDWERAHGAPRTPILALTANALRGEDERCLELGMDDFLIKPVTIPLLASKLRQWMPHLTLGEALEAPATPSTLATLATPSPETVGWMHTGIDSKTLLDLCGGSAGSAQEILDDFIAATTADLLVMQDGLQQQDEICVVRQSHRVKGSAAMIGARDLAGRAAKLEAYARIESPDWSIIQEHLAGIQEALKALETSVE